MSASRDSQPVRDVLPDWLARRAEHPDLCPVCGLPAAAELALALGELQEVPKTGSAQIPTNSGGSFSYRFLELSDLGQAVRTVLAAHHLALMQPATTVDQAVRVTTVIRHTSGTLWESPPLELRTTGDPKQLGGTIAYLRRYSLAAYVALAGDEPDASTRSEASSRSSTTRRVDQVTPTRRGGSGAQAEAQPEPEEPTPTAMWAALRGTGMADSDSRLWVAELLGIPDGWTSADLTRPQIGAVLDRLARGPGGEPPAPTG